jgi:hypothetical protein
MAFNTTNETQTENFSILLQSALVIPEYFNWIFLILGIYGMYQGIEIQHPLYAILFLNLIVPFVFTSINIVAFFFIPIYKFFIIANSSSGLSIYFHSVCWCMTSVIRYIYIFHENWIHSHIPNHKIQCLAAIGLTLTFCVFLSSPAFISAIYIGNYFYFQSYIEIDCWQKNRSKTSSLKIW